MDRTTLKIRLILWLIIAITLAWFLFMALVPSGNITYAYNFAKPDRFIGKLGPRERVLEPVKNSQKIIGNPVYFSLFTPRFFDTAKLTLKYKIKEAPGSNNLSLVEAGVLADKTVWRYNLKPVENRVIDQLSLVWDLSSEGEKILLQKKRQYKNIDEFLANPPELTKIAVYNFDPRLKYLIKDYQTRDAKEADLVIPVSLRGSWQMYVYLKNESLDLSFDFRDLNQNRDADPINLFLFSNNTLINSQKLDDDGVVKDNGQESKIRHFSLSVPGLSEGVYKIELKVNDDIVTEKIASKQNRLSFINRINVYEIPKNGVELFTDSKKLQAVTSLQEGLQTISVGALRLKVDATFKQFESVINRASSSDKYASIKLNKAKIVISGRGVFAFDSKMLINPELKKVDGDLDVLREGIEYVLASYKAPKIEDAWKKAEIDFDLRSAFNENRKYGFAISVPGLKIDDEIDDYLEIGGLEVELKGESLWGVVRRKMY